MAEEPKRPNVAIGIPRDLYEVLVAVARNRGVSRASVARVAIVEHLKASGVPLPIPEAKVTRRTWE